MEDLWLLYKHIFPPDTPPPDRVFAMGGMVKFRWGVLQLITRAFTKRGGNVGKTRTCTEKIETM
jgi:hypothetical protein